MEIYLLVVILVIGFGQAKRLGSRTHSLLEQVCAPPIAPPYPLSKVKVLHFCHRKLPVERVDCPQHGNNSYDT